MSPTVRRREIIQGKVVQIGNYPAAWSQDNPLEITAQVHPQLCGIFEEFWCFQEEQTGKIVFVS